MKYKYEFANENKTIEISEEWISVLEELDRLEYNNNHAETRRHVSLVAQHRKRRSIYQMRRTDLQQA